MEYSSAAVQQGQEELAEMMRIQTEGALQRGEHK